jgi:hypothetical protein
LLTFRAPSLRSVRPVSEITTDRGGVGGGGLGDDNETEWKNICYAKKTASNQIGKPNEGRKRSRLAHSLTRCVYQLNFFIFDSFVNKCLTMSLAASGTGSHTEVLQMLLHKTPTFSAINCETFAGL